MKGETQMPLSSVILVPFWIDILVDYSQDLMKSAEALTVMLVET
jgi:hypothetical protein